ncbi:MAG: cysteinyl-tRNA synthetase [Burkholderiales bacterium]|jgi:cysteinyl-tRNA synthetase|nr:cysteinyl-tRNA synthetase [Burkholderiales bacterium]
MKIYNSFTRQKEEFVPIEKNQIKMYVCGQTVYDYCHLGHARKSVVFDMVRRWFIASDYMVSYVENITDIDDKIINRAIENKEDINTLTSRFIAYMHEDFDKLGIIRPDLEPRATEYIPQMLNIIESLIEKGYAYQASNGDVYYAVRKFVGYGQLSGKTLDSLRAGERVEVDTNKQDPLDFVLWKASKQGEPFWESKFGNGRPGWHIECSAMSEELLGKNFDIHGGGQDLQFPHHENEIAQSEAHNSCKFANYWMHNGFLNINDEKMSKSLGNFFTLRDVLDKYDAETIRFFMLRTHYRSPLNFSHDGLSDAKGGLTRLYTAIKPYTINKDEHIDWNIGYASKFKQAMDDDFNTALAISVLFEIVSQINKEPNQQLAELLVMLSRSIGLLTREVKEFFNSSSKISPKLIEEQIKNRQIAKQNKDFALADKIRNDLLEQGIILEDKPTGTIWRNG